MGNRLIIFAALLVSVALLASCSTHESRPIPTSKAVPSEVPSPVQDPFAMQHPQEAAQLLDFIETQLSGPDGIYTNLLDTDQSDEAATGHEVLSESASLIMRSAVLGGNQELFDRHWSIARAVFDMDGGFSYRYSPKLEKQYPVNAAVDDLRLIGALYDAGKAFADRSYTEEADKYALRFYSNNVKDGYLKDFYDNYYKNTNEFITLCYINLSVLQKLSIPDGLRGILLHNMTGILQEGYLSNEFPFYETRFDYRTGKYSSENINTVESLLSILNLTEMKRQNPRSITYIKEQVEAGTLYGQYTRDGQPANDIRSTAIYALAAMIGAEAGDDDLYQAGLARMNEFRITDPDSPLYGGFGNPDTGEAYSFDNLMALLAYSY
ncbi:hypothetical protein C2I18_11115 [Paenibacillus sp. PK3_47]|uniref:glycosyl hydrolase family 8 n=1 Tax=Paenibacillus sp. PK3_47 TaxID=2072642 RepID=UPI00201D35FE|nr:glycosyl hydrolase family 8 [Paenibacillus sp. PK3_47]UQZ34031.1 hypothetical protein C2I18_11115 [Paenibacillus sp. PK3_47]